MINKLKNDLQSFNNSFNEAGIPWVLIDGFVLGYARNKKIIPWDTDIDLAVCREIPQDKKEQLLYDIFPKHGLKVVASKKRWDFIYGTGQTSFNLWFYHKEGDYYVAYPPTTPKVKFIEKAESYDNIQRLEFEGGLYPMPGDIDGYISDRYGVNWKNETWEHDGWYMEKRGVNRFTELSISEQQDKWVKSRCGKDGDLWPKIIYREDNI